VLAQRAVLAENTIIKTVVFALHDLDDVEGGAVEHDRAQPRSATLAHDDALAGSQQGDQMGPGRMPQQQHPGWIASPRWGLVLHEGQRACDVVGLFEQVGSSGHAVVRRHDDLALGQPVRDLVRYEA
jgi:hypothetical protein